MHAAFDSRKQVIETVKGAIARRQGSTGEATAIDPTLINRTRLASDPIGSKRPPKDVRLLRLHSDILRLAEAGVAAEKDRVGELVAAIEEHIGSGAPLTLKTIQDSVNEAVEEARLAGVLSPPDARERIDRKLATSTAAAETVEDARRAIRAAEKGVTADALERLSSVDAQMLEDIADYLDAASGVIESSIAAARAVITAGTGGDTEAAVPVRKAIARAIETVGEVH